MSNPARLQSHEYLPTAKHQAEQAHSRLLTLDADILERTVINAADHKALGVIINGLYTTYNLLDAIYPQDEKLIQLYDDAMALIELVNARLSAVVDFIRPYRIEHAVIDADLTRKLINSDVQYIVSVIGNITAIIELSEATV